jgi:hypothetical protein
VQHRLFWDSERVAILEPQEGHEETTYNFPLNYFISMKRG